MAQWTDEAENIMRERFGKDSLIALATVIAGTPYARTVNAFYDRGAFFILTDARSNKIRQLADNPCAAIAGDWFTGHAKAQCLGALAAPENRAVSEKMRAVFSSWIDNGHSNPEDPNTVILRLELTDGVLFSHGTRYSFP